MFSFGGDQEETCTAVFGNSTVWEGQLDGYNKLKGVFSLVASVTNTSSAVREEGEQTRVTLAVKVFARDYDGEPWSMIRNFSTVETTVSCRRGWSTCDDVVILSEAAMECLRCNDSFTFYRQYRAQVFNPLETALLRYGTGLTYSFVFHNSGFRLKEAFMRMAFLAVTIAWLAVYLLSLRHTPWGRWLPEQRWIAMLLASLILFLNPFFLPLLYAPDHVRVENFFFPS